MGFKIQNTYKLITNEDNLIIHKLLGISCLINFIYQFYYLMFYEYLPLASSKYKDLILTLHGLLSLSSFIFHVPKNRHKGLPMIYKEFRLHSIVFALRSVLCSFVYSHNFIYGKFCNLLIINLTMILADISTIFYGADTKTMRGMPFGDKISETDKQLVTRMHSLQQFSATIYMFLNFETAFVPLVAIQLAAFLMTLVRKSIIKELDWHRIYAITLWICIFAINTVDFKNYIFMVFANFFVFWLRINYGVNKYIVWNTLGIISFIFFSNSFYIYEDQISNSTLRLMTNLTICYYLIKNIYKTRALWI